MSLEAIFGLMWVIDPPGFVHGSKLRVELSERHFLITAREKGMADAEIC